MKDVRRVCDRMFSPHTGMLVGAEAIDLVDLEPQPTDPCLGRNNVTRICSLRFKVIYFRGI